MFHTLLEASASVEGDNLCAALNRFKKKTKNKVPLEWKGNLERAMSAVKEIARFAYHHNERTSLFFFKKICETSSLVLDLVCVERKKCE